MSEEQKPDYHVVSLSGGKDSTAMLHLMIEHDMPIDEVIFVDTGKEFPQMYDHLDRIEENTGINITRLNQEKSFDYFMFDHPRDTGDYKGVKGYGWARPFSRWCTARLKRDVIKKYFREKKKLYNVIQYVGIAVDEPKRIRGEKYPLVDLGITEKQALEYCYKLGYDWGGLYEKFKRVSCWCCPLQNLNSLRTLRHDFPDLWEELRDMDERSWNDFRQDYSVAELEDKFAIEDRQMELFS